MTSLIGSFLARFFQTKQYRGLILGLDAAGKTTILYKVKLGEVVTTIPTIGFNVEDIVCKGTTFTLWDVGGCDKVRALWRHYFQNTQVIVFVVDAADKERFHSDSRHGSPENTSQGLFFAAMAEEEIKDAVVLVLVNKSDLPGAMKADYVRQEFQVDSTYSHRRIRVQPCCAKTGEGIMEGLEWLAEGMSHPAGAKSTSPPPLSSSTAPSAATSLTASTPQPSAESKPALLEEWLNRVDEDDDTFLAKLQDLTLNCWDHYTHLRIAYLYLTRLGRRQALPLIFSSIKTFIEQSSYLSNQDTKRTTYHETMTYFWIHMVHYAIVATKLPEPSFKLFLVMNPQLSNGGLFLQYYSKQLMLMDPKSRTEMVLPDLKPLPSVVPSSPLVPK